MLRIVEDGDALAEGVTVAGRYTLERVVGEGGMGVVWAARHVLTHKACALKFLKERRAHDPKSYERLLREARAACAVRHPNVAQVHDLLELPSGAPFIVMDLLDGEPLSRRLERDRPLSRELTLDVLLPTMDAVLAAHALGIVHRDLKPDNVFLERRAEGDFAVKVLDFGIAKRAELVDDVVATDVAPDLARSVTSTYSVLGTPKYMAPEQAQATGKVGFATDVWALGMIAYECATGELPPAVDPDDDERAARIAARLRDADFPAEIASLIARMLALDPDDRPELAVARDGVARARSAGPPSAPARSRAWMAGLGAFGLVLVAAGWIATRPAAVTPERAAQPAASAPTSAPIASPALTIASATPTATTVEPPLASAPTTTPATTRTAARPAGSIVRAIAPSASVVAPPAPSSSQGGIPTRVRD
jgi:serine/threonine-protein kinase